MTLDRFPARAFDLPLPPMASVSSITYLDTDGDTQTLATTEYRVLNAANPNSKGRIERAFGVSWPSTRAVEQSVTVTYVAGYGARNAVPEHIRHLLRIMVKLAYDNRDPMVPINMIMSPALVGLFEMARFPAVA